MTKGLLIGIYMDTVARLSLSDLRCNAIEVFHPLNMF